MSRCITLTLAALLATAAPALAGGIICKVNLDKKSYTHDKDGMVTFVVELDRPDMDCAPTAFIESHPKQMGPVILLERKNAKGDWVPHRVDWAPPPSWGENGPKKAGKDVPFRIDWGCSLKVKRTAKLPAAVYRVRVALRRATVKGHRFEFTSKPFTVFAQCKKTKS